ncbi:MAG: hypothetical protein WC679_00270 [Bacteroidales bacterium]|jgi:hypothetical protein
MKGLYKRYEVKKIVGKTDPNADYFVLRLDDGGSDYEHIHACRMAMMTYADEYKCVNPVLAKEIIEKYDTPDYWNKISELKSALRAALDYIDALPSDVVATLPVMPGFDRDWVEDMF